jgi:Tol biopolymer transport system component
MTLASEATRRHRTLLAIALVLSLSVIAAPATRATGGETDPPAGGPTATIPRLAYIDRHGLRVVGADGSGERTLDVATGQVRPAVWDALLDPSWHPDGSRIAYSRSFGAAWTGLRTELRIAAIDGPMPYTLLTLSGGVILNVRWSPDGNRLAFVLYTPNPAWGAVWGLAGNRWDIYVVNADGSGLRPLAPAHPNEASSLDWSPDGTRLAFISDAEGVNGVYTVAVDGVSLPARLSPPMVVAAHPRWSPDGESIAFTGVPVTEVLREHHHLWIVDADGSDARRLPAQTWLAPTWSPDGMWLAYEWGGLSVIRRDGLAGRKLTTRSARWPVWSRHGQIAFVDSDDTERCCVYSLWVINGDGSDERRLTDATDVAPGLAWSA